MNMYYLQNPQAIPNKDYYSFNSYPTTPYLHIKSLVNDVTEEVDCCSSKPDINPKKENNNALFIFSCKTVDILYPHLKNCKSIEYSDLCLSKIDKQLIDHFYFINDKRITSYLCKHDLEFLVENSLLPFHKLPLLIISLLTLHYSPCLNLYHHLPQYLLRVRDIARQVLELSKHTNLTYTNHYYIDIAKELFSYLPYYYYY